MPLRGIADTCMRQDKGDSFLSEEVVNIIRSGSASCLIADSARCDRGTGWIR